MAGYTRQETTLLTVTLLMRMTLMLSTMPLRQGLTHLLVTLMTVLQVKVRLSLR